MFKTLLKHLLILFCCFFILAKPVLAEEKQRLPGFISQTEFIQALDNAPNLTTWSMETMGNVLWGASTMLNGVRRSDGTIQAGATQYISLLQTALYTHPPVSNRQYLADFSTRLGLIKPAHAATTGLEAMRPILELWETIRNIAYIFFIIIFVVFGFMIMFRTKLDPQTVITIQLALPKIVIGLILVTFSFAISGLFIDLSEVLTKLIASAFSSFAGLDGTNSAILYRLTNIYNCFDESTSPATPIRCAGANIKEFYANIFTVMMPLLNLGGISNSIQSAITSIATQLESDLGPLGTIAGALAGIIFGLAMIQAMFKTFFMLLTSYVNIVLSTLLSPFVFLISSVFGKGALTGWFKNFLANVLVFPFSFAILTIAAIFLAHNPDVRTKWGVREAKGPESFTWYPAPLGIYWKADDADPDNPDLFTFELQLINNLIAFGLVLATPRTIDLIKGALEGKGAPGVGADIGQAVMRGASKIPIIGTLVGG